MTRELEPIERSPMRSGSNLEDPVDRKHLFCRPWWEQAILGRLSNAKAELIDEIIDSGDDAPRLFARFVYELGIAPKLARKWIKAALRGRGRPEKVKDLQCPRSSTRPDRRPMKTANLSSISKADR